MSTLPTHTVYSVTKKPGNYATDPKSFWKPIGAAWMHKDGNGLSLRLEYLPLDPTAQIVIRIRKEDEQREATAEPQPTPPGHIERDEIPF